MTKINVKIIVKYWQEGAERSWDVAKSLWKSKKYDFCLFCCHLTLEKILKAIVVKKSKKHAPHGHNLLILAKKAKIELNEKQAHYLAQITEFNISARYPEIKLKFYKMCTKNFSEEYFNFTKKFYLWLKKYLKNL
ncbi:DNA-binding protein [bacterium]|nr:DNA-binding protein [bacterium]|tara:strand:+ start:532 stop:936 length:405 start_codon:yes stop_codon:yes gene_type:complete